MLSVGGGEKSPTSERASETSGSADGVSEAGKGSAAHPAVSKSRNKTLQKAIQRFILQVLPIQTYSRRAVMNQSEAGDLFQPPAHPTWQMHNK